MKKLEILMLAIAATFLLDGCAAVVECLKPSSAILYHSDRNNVQLQCTSENLL